MGMYIFVRGRFVLAWDGNVVIVCRTLAVDRGHIGGHVQRKSVCHSRAHLVLDAAVAGSSPHAS
jgi:hypothetical protein